MTFFETEFFPLDPNSQYESDYLSFSSLIDLCPPVLDSNALNTKDVGSNTFSSTSSPSFSEPYDVLNDDYEPQTPKCGEAGIFHTPPKRTNGYEDCNLLTPDLTSSSPVDTLITPFKSSKSSVGGYDQYSYNIPTDTFLSSSRSGFSWDDASSSFSGATYQPPSVAPRAMRVTSNPTLEAPRNPRFVKQVVSMPLMKEEPLNAESNWDNSDGFVPDGQQEVDVGYVNNEASVDGFRNVFSNVSIGENGANTAADVLTFQPPEGLDSSTQYTVSTGDIQSIPSSSSDTMYIQAPSSSSSMPSWQSQTSTMQAHVGLFPALEIPQPGTLAAGPKGDFTINPKAVMCFDGEGQSVMRPSTAPGLRGEETAVLLGPPMSEPMNRR